VTPTPRLERDQGAAFAAGGGGTWDSGALGPHLFLPLPAPFIFPQCTKRDPPMAWVARASVTVSNMVDNVAEGDQLTKLLVVITCCAVLGALSSPWVGVGAFVLALVLDA